MLVLAHESGVHSVSNAHTPSAPTYAPNAAQQLALAIPPNHSLKQPAAAVAWRIPVSSQVRRFAAAHCSLPFGRGAARLGLVARGGRCLAQSRWARGLKKSADHALCAYL